VTVGASSVAGSPAAFSSLAFSSLAALVRRSLVALWRQPAAWLPGAALPLVLAAVFTANYDRIAQLAGFPAHLSYLGYVLPAAVLIGGLYAGIAAGTSVTSDLVSGFQRRLLLTQVPRLFILAGPLAAAIVQSVLQSCLFLVVFRLAGAAWPASVPLLLVATALFAAGIAGLAIAIGLSTRDNEVMQSTFGVLLLAMFVSSAFFPVNLMRGWFAAASSHSPLTWLANGIRAAHPVPALVTPLVLVAVSLSLAVLALRSGSRA
jgi:ABC-2 type transport system permease protein